jgi:uncharacterized protein YcfJ
MNAILKYVLAAAMVAVAAQASAQITFYENEAFEGRSFGTEQAISNFKRSGFNDRASSAVVFGNRWEVCENVDFGGRCVILRPGRYESFAAMGLNDRISSVRNVPRGLRTDDNRHAPGAPDAQITFYELEGFGGRTLIARQDIGDFRRESFNDRASSVVVAGGHWEVCEAAGFKGRCVLLRPGQYASLAAMGLNDRVSSVRAAGAQSQQDDHRPAPPPEVSAQVTFYENEGFAGRAFSIQQDVGDFRRQGFNDRASSVVVSGERWELCDAVGFTGRCVVLGPGQYASLSAMGLNNSVSSVRSVSTNPRVADGRYAPAHVATYGYRRRDNEPLYQADVVAVRAVVGTADQRCWVEREQVPQDRSNANVPGAVVGAVIGGILGHQVGNGRGKDLATAAGAVAGAVVGSNVGRDSGPQQAPEVQRCVSVPSQDRPDYWDVTYTFRGQEHRMQMSTPPGPTVNVNAQGEPRG